MIRALLKLCRASVDQRTPAFAREISPRKIKRGKRLMFRRAER